MKASTFYICELSFKVFKSNLWEWIASFCVHRLNWFLIVYLIFALAVPEFQPGPGKSSGTRFGPVSVAKIPNQVILVPVSEASTAGETNPEIILAQATTDTLTQHATSSKMLLLNTTQLQPAVAGLNERKDEIPLNTFRLRARASSVTVSPFKRKVYPSSDYVFPTVRNSSALST